MKIRSELIISQFFSSENRKDHVSRFLQDSSRRSNARFIPKLSRIPERTLLRPCPWRGTRILTFPISQETNQAAANQSKHTFAKGTIALTAEQAARHFSNAQWVEDVVSPGWIFSSLLLRLLFNNSTNFRRHTKRTKSICARGISSRVRVANFSTLITRIHIDE